MDEQTNLAILDDTLDKFEGTAGLPKLEELNFTSQVEWAMKHDFKVRLTPEQYAEYAAILSRHSFYIQRVINKQSSRAKWIEDRITALITPRLNQQKSTFYPEKRMLAIAENEVARKLQQELTKCHVRMERLNYIGMKIKDMADTYTELNRTARARRIE